MLETIRSDVEHTINPSLMRRITA